MADKLGLLGLWGLGRWNKLHEKLSVEVGGLSVCLSVCLSLCVCVCLSPLSVSVSVSLPFFTSPFSCSLPSSPFPSPLLPLPLPDTLYLLSIFPHNSCSKISRK